MYGEADQSLPGRPLRIDYVVYFSVTGRSGKSKATREKIKYLRETVPDARCFSADRIRKWCPVAWLSGVLVELDYLRLALFSRRPHIIITRPLLGIAVLLAARVTGATLLKEVHTDTVDEANVLFAEQPLRRGVLRLIGGAERLLLPSCDGILFNNDVLRRHFVSRYRVSAARSCTVANGTDPSAFFPIETAEARRALALDPERHYLVFVGSVSVWHGAQSMIEVFGAIRDSGYHKVDLIIVGGSNSKHVAELKKLDPRVVFVGPAPPATALQFMNAADICLLPAADVRISPGSPLKLFDYAACGKPIVCQADLEGYSDIVSRHRLGSAVDFTNARAAARQIMQFIETLDASWYRRNNRQIAEQTLSWASVIDRWVRFASGLRLADRATLGRGPARR